MGNCQAVEAATMVIQHPNGKIERMYWSISAYEVMKLNPGHYVSIIIPLPSISADDDGMKSLMRSTRVKLLRPTDTLQLGHAYRLFSSQEVKKVLAKQLARTKVSEIGPQIDNLKINKGSDKEGKRLESENVDQTCGNVLEKLWIENSEHLTRIVANDSNVVCSALRCLTISDCTSMKTIDIHLPKLVTFVYELGSLPGLELLCIRNASHLSNVTIQVEYEDHLFFVLLSLAEYFSQLEFLKVNWFLNSESNTDPEVDYFPVLGKLMHLELHVCGNIDRNIAGWVSFIQACPLLEKLTMELRFWDFSLPSNNMKCDKHPLLYLMTFEIVGFDGENVDVDVAKFVFDNGVALQEVIFQGCSAINVHESLANLNLKLPQTVEITTT